MVPGGPRPAPLTGDLPSPYAPPPGCAFHTRCPLAFDLCRSKAPALRRIGTSHTVACHLAEDADARLPIQEPFA